MSSVDLAMRERSGERGESPAVKQFIAKKLHKAKKKTVFNNLKNFPVGEKTTFNAPRHIPGCPDRGEVFQNRVTKNCKKKNAHCKTFSRFPTPPI